MYCDTGAGSGWLTNEASDCRVPRADLWLSAGSSIPVKVLLAAFVFSNTSLELPNACFFLSLKMWNNENPYVFKRFKNLIWNNQGESVWWSLVLRKSDATRCLSTFFPPLPPQEPSEHFSDLVYYLSIKLFSHQNCNFKLFIKISSKCRCKYMKS